MNIGQKSSFLIWTIHVLELCEISRFWCLAALWSLCICTYLYVSVVKLASKKHHSPKKYGYENRRVLMLWSRRVCGSFSYGRDSGFLLNCILGVLSLLRPEFGCFSKVGRIVSWCSLRLFLKSEQNTAPLLCWPVLRNNQTLVKVAPAQPRISSRSSTLNLFHCSTCVKDSDVRKWTSSQKSVDVAANK